MEAEVAQHSEMGPDIIHSDSESENPEVESDTKLTNTESNLGPRSDKHPVSRRAATSC